MQEQFELGKMIHNLLQIDDETWGLYAFSRELLNRRILPDKKAEMITKAMDCGKEYAKQIIREYGCRDINIISEKLKLKIEFQDTLMTGQRILFACYTPPDKIEIKKEPIRRAVLQISEEDTNLVELFRQDGIISTDIIPSPMVVRAQKRPEVAYTMGACEHGIISTDIMPVPMVVRAHKRHEVAHTMGACEHGIMNTILGHEIFHFIEERFAKEIYTRTEKILLWNFMGLKNYSTIRTLGEIGAMAFTKELNGLNFSPFILDILLYYSYDSSDAEKIYRDVLGMSSGRCRKTVEDY